MLKQCSISEIQKVKQTGNRTRQSDITLKKVVKMVVHPRDETIQLIYIHGFLENRRGMRYGSSRWVWDFNLYRIVFSGLSKYTKRNSD
jgi:hypothetical protein